LRRPKASERVPEKIFVIDALFAIYNGGPAGSPQAIPRTLILSRDPVACDSIGVEMINHLRTANGYTPWPSPFLPYAESIGLGSRILQVIRITNPSAVAREPEAGGREDDFALLPPRPNPFTGATEISFLLPETGAVSLDVFNALGARVKRVLRGALPAGNHSAHWDGRDESGHKAPTGIYYVQLKWGEAAMERPVTLIR